MFSSRSPNRSTFALLRPSGRTLFDNAYLLKHGFEISRIIWYGSPGVSLIAVQST